MDSQVAASIIQTSGTVISTIITVMGAWFIGKIVINRKKLIEDYEEARGDIAFLLAVEKAHCEKHLEDIGENHKNRIRDQVRFESPLLKWSGNHTPGRNQPKY